MLTSGFGDSLEGASYIRRKLAIMEKTIATIEKNKREEIRIALTAYQGYDLCDIRVFAEPYAGDMWVATKKGISLSVAKLPALIVGLREAEREAREAGLLTDTIPEAVSAAA